MDTAMEGVSDEQLMNPVEREQVNEMKQRSQEQKCVIILTRNKNRK
jgi:hypothetical protein